MLELGGKSALRDGQICQVSNELKENRRSLFDDSSRNVLNNKIFVEWLKEV